MALFLSASLAQAAKQTQSADVILQRAKQRVYLLEHPEAKEQLKAKKAALKEKQKAERETLKAKQKQERDALKVGA